MNYEDYDDIDEYYEQQNVKNGKMIGWNLLLDAVIFVVFVGALIIKGILN